jgi:hypothetical protein
MKKTILVGSVCLFLIISVFSGCVNVPKEITQGTDDTALPEVTPSITLTVDSDAHTMIVTGTSGNIQWSDIAITNDTGSATCHWALYTDGGTLNASTNKIPLGKDVTAGDYVFIWYSTVKDVKITFRYVPTNSLLGTWTISV